MAKHKSMLDDVRRNKKYLLSEKEEVLLTRLSPFGGGEWDDAMDEWESALNFELDGDKLKLSEVLQIMNYDKSAGRRAAALKSINETLKDSRYAWLRTRASHSSSVQLVLNCI